MSPDQKPSKPIDIYVRVSQVQGRDVEAKGGTAAEQERRARLHLESKGLLVGETFSDLNVSGGKESRPAFDQVLARIKSGVSGGLICKDLSRFGRHLRVEEQILEIEAQGGTVILLDDNIDTSTPTGQLLLGFMTRLNKYYRDIAARQLRGNQENAIEEGVSTYQAPWGYVRPVVSVNKKTGKKKYGPFEVDEELRAAVVEVFERRARGETQQQIVDWLTETGVRKATWNRVDKKTGELVCHSKPWSTDTVRDILKNEAYVGVVERKGVGRNENAHEALVSRELFQRVQAQRGRAHHDKRRGSFLLTGYVRCAGCGGAMTYSTSGNGKYSFLICRSGKGCPDGAGIAASALEPFVAERLAEAVIVDVQRPRSNTDRLDALRLQRDHLQAERDEYAASWSAAGTPAALATEILVGLDKRIEQVEEEILALPTEDEDEIWTKLRPSLRESILKVEEELRAEGIEVKHSADDLTEADLDAMTERMKAGAERRYQEGGLGGEDLLDWLLLKTGDKLTDEALLASKRNIFKRYLGSVTVTGKATEKGYRGQETEASVAARVEVRTK